MTNRRFLCAVLCLAGCTARPPAPPANDAVVTVIGRGWHSDVALPVDTLTGPLAAIARDWPGANFLVFGFGERAFVVDRRTSFLDMLVALLPSPGVLLVTGLSAPPANAFGDDQVVALPVSNAGLRQIEARIARSLPQGVPEPLADGPYPGSAYYAADERYDGFNTCNSWTANVLRAGGLAVPSGALFVSQVMGPARWLADHPR